MAPATRTREHDHQPSHVVTVAHLCALVVASGCGGGGASPDARFAECSETAEPHDEDGDAIFDDCDNCPTVANPSQLDSTEVAVHAFPDGVGDACDPRAGLSGDKLDELYTFASAPAGWDGWMIVDDAARASGDATWTSARTPNGDGLFVRAEVTTFSPLDPTGTIAIVLDEEAAAVRGTCTLFPDHLDVLAGTSETASVMFASPIGADEPFTLIGWRIITGTTTRTERIICRVVRGSVTKEASVMLPDGIAIGSRTISVVQADVVLGSVSVYTSPPPKKL